MLLSTLIKFLRKPTVHLNFVYLCLPNQLMLVQMNDRGVEILLNTDIRKHVIFLKT